MLDEAKHLFPQLLEQKINALLDFAEPSPQKAFQLYKSCKNEELWTESFEKFAQHLNSFFAISQSDRRKSDVDAFLDRPLSSEIFEQFHLNFHNAIVDQRSVLNIANWAHNLLRVQYKTNCQIISQDVLTKALQYITHPPLFEKSLDIKFEDFCSAWKKTVFKLFGKKYDAEFNHLISELRWLDAQLKTEKMAPHEPSFSPTIYLTQTEIEWTEAVLSAVSTNSPVPKFPLSRGPSKRRLIDLERTIRLYQIVQNTKLPEFIKHRDSIRSTILSRCESLLRERAR